MCAGFKTCLGYIQVYKVIPHFHATWCVCVCVCVLYNNYSCVKPSAPPRKTMLPAEGQGQRERQRVEKGGEWKKGEGATM